MHTDLTYIKKLASEAHEACEYGIRHNKSKIVVYDDLGINTLFTTQSREDIERFVQNIFGPLDEAKNELSFTLLTYVAHNGSPKETANALFIHINTLYQRLRKIEKLLQISLDNREQYLNVQLACYLYDTYIV